MGCPAWAWERGRGWSGQTERALPESGWRRRWREVLGAEPPPDGLQHLEAPCL